LKDVVFSLFLKKHIIIGGKMNGIKGPKIQQKFYIGEPENVREKIIHFFQGISLVIFVIILLLIIGFIIIALLSKTTLAPIHLQNLVNAIENI
jgi:hypothetical protein